MKPLWKGSIAFGLVTIPVKLYKATEEKSLSFHHLHRGCDARIRLKRVCSACEQEVGFDDIVKGYEYEPDQHVVLSEADLDRGASHTRAIAISKFVIADEVDPIHFSAAYYLGPEEVGARAYRLLVEAMRRTGRLALATITLRERERHVLLRLRDEVIVLETLLWPDEIRTPFVGDLSDIDVSEQEVEMATTLVASLAGRFDPDEMRDGYRERLEALIAARLAGEELPVEQVEPPKVVELMDALAASLRAVEEHVESRTGS